MRMTWALLALGLATCGPDRTTTDSGSPPQDAGVDAGPLPTYCADSSGCPAGQGCALGVCRARCMDPMRCPSGTECYTDTGDPTCVPSCTATTPCDRGTVCVAPALATHGLCGAPDAGM